MKKGYLYLIAALAVILIGTGWYAYKTDTQDAETGNSAEMELPVSVTPISHATAVLGWGDDVIYLDPVGGAEAFAEQPRPDIVFLTDIHGDHLDIGTLNAVVGENTTLIAPQAVADDLPQTLRSRTRVLDNGSTLDERGFGVRAIPMYNLPESEDAFHVKGRGNGYVIERGGFSVYVAGDTAGIPEMRALTGIDMAFVPMNLPYTMTVDEAADAVLDFAPARVYPYHYRGSSGLSNTDRFKELVESQNEAVDVVLLDWYPNE